MVALAVGAFLGLDSWENGEARGERRVLEIRVAERTADSGPGVSGFFRIDVDREARTLRRS